MKERGAALHAVRLMTATSTQQ